MMLDSAIGDAADTVSGTALITLVEMIEALSGARTIDQVAAVVRSSARRISGADGVAFVLRDGDQCWYVDEDAMSPLWKGARFPLTDCIAGWAMLNRQTVIIPDIYCDERVPHDAYRQTFVKSLVMTPVRPEDPAAVIGAYWARNHTPSAETVAKLQVMARATAAALENGRLYGSLNESLARHTFLLRELDHRVKNTLAAVQSIAFQTLRTAASPTDFTEAFEARLMAISRAHEMLTRQSWGLTDLGEIVATALEPFGGVHDPRFTVRGPDIRITAERAVTAHMTLHELAVNAAKHGALSTPQGRVDIAWTIDEAPGARSLTFTWLERGGPPVCGAPRRQGFGSRLIERGLARDLGGSAEMRFEPEGLRFVLHVPLTLPAAPA